MTDWKMIHVESGYGGNTRQPFVEIKADKLKEPLQLSPEEARDLASNLLQAAESAEQDAFIVEFHSDFIEGTSEEKRNVGAVMLMEFRKWRDAHGQNR
jgi:hypothetical protein